MKIRKLLEIQSIIESKAIPSDLENLEPYHSKSRGELLDILDMDLIHLLRAYNKIDKYENISEKDFVKKIKNKIDGWFINAN
tara:strand:+ start:16330 stop:16575 length:246 start_codon:yes stop_codon:yes gene_type:complete